MTARPLPSQAVLFDLDGTLLDTAPDLAFALNETLQRTGRAPLPFETIRPVVSHGGTALIRLGFGLGPGEAGFEPLRERFLAIYRENIARQTALFEGMGELLDTLESRGVHWGVVTNKPAWLTEPLLAALGLAPRACAVVSGDTLPQRKPDPAPLLLACRRAGIEAERCIYIGDTERDIEAGRRAGMRTLVALFGYLAADDRPESWRADGLVARPQDILHWISPSAAA